MVSADCFHQFFVANPENLKKWLRKNPYDIGKMETIQQAFDRAVNPATDAAR